MEECIKKILTTAVHAPSGDNSQPWQFKIRGETLEIFNLPERDNEIFNFEQRGSYIAHGALIENIKILASNEGLASEISLFPDNNESDLVAKITLKKQPEIFPDLLATVIKKRSTNRKKYYLEPLTENQKSTLQMAVKEIGFGKLLLIEDNEKKHSLGKAASNTEMIMLEYRPLHDAFFKLLVWDDANKIGMNVKTLELLPPQKLIFKLFQYWPIDRIFSVMRLPLVVAKENAKTYAKCAAIGGIVMPNTNKEDFIYTGRLLQRIWLTATALNLNIQPIAGMLYLEKSLEHGKLINLKPKWQNLIRQSKNIIYECFKSQGSIPTMIFRIGKPTQPPSSVSPKLLPQIIDT